MTRLGTLAVAAAAAFAVQGAIPGRAAAAGAATVTADAAPAGGAADAGTAAPAAAAPAANKSAPAVSVRLSAHRVELGKVFHAYVTVKHAANVQINLPASLHLGDDFEETGRKHTTAKGAAGAVIEKFDLSLMAFNTGDLKLPPIELTYAAHGTAQQIESSSVPIHVVGVIGPGKPKLRDVAAPVAVMRRDLTPLYVLGGVLAAILLALGLLLARRRGRARRRRAAEAEVRARRPADEEALARLDALEASGALDAADRKPAYVDMSEIIREYIGRRYGFPALELTTREILDHARGRPEMAPLLELIDGWLEECDLVKYADYDASPDEARRSFYRGRLVVERTRVRLATPPGAEADAAVGAAGDVAAEDGAAEDVAAEDVAAEDVAAEDAAAEDVAAGPEGDAAADASAGVDATPAADATEDRAPEPEDRHA